MNDDELESINILSYWTLVLDNVMYWFEKLMYEEPG